MWTTFCCLYTFSANNVKVWLVFDVINVITVLFNRQLEPCMHAQPVTIANPSIEDLATHQCSTAITAVY